MSVAVVRKIEEASAGSKLSFFKTKGTVNPTTHANTIFPIIESSKTTPKK